jgi:adenine specific DNA methylase Mod
MKPVALVERAIRNSRKTGDIVRDPFGGSGSTLIACEKTGRQARPARQALRPAQPLVSLTCLPVVNRRG